MTKKNDESGPHKTPIPKLNARQRAHAATERTVEIHDRVRVAADRVSRDIDDLTHPGVPIPISDEDSIVTSLEAMIEQRKAASGC